MTAEEIRVQYTENLSSIAMLHTKNAALVDELRKLGFDFYEESQEPQEDMSDPKNWRVGDLVECVTKDYENVIALGSIQMVLHIGENDLRITDKTGSSRCPLDEVLTYYKFHSRPSK